MATGSIANIDLTILDNSAFAIINHLREQNKRINLDKIYDELIKTINFQNTSKEHLYNKINELIIQGKIRNKPNRNDYSYRINVSIIDFNIKLLEYSSLLASDLYFATPNTKHSSTSESVKPINNIPKRLSIYLKRILIAKNLSKE